MAVQIYVGPSIYVPSLAEISVLFGFKIYVILQTLLDCSESGNRKSILSNFKMTPRLKRNNPSAFIQAKICLDGNRFEALQRQSCC